MAIIGSPGVTTREVDYTIYTQATSTTIGGLVGNFAWGPCDEPMTIADEAALVNYYDKPNDENYKDWFTARNFLNYSGNLRLCRICANDAFNACDDITGKRLIKNATEFGKLEGTLAEESQPCSIFARYPGAFGNKLRVVIASRDTLYPEVLDEDGNSTGEREKKMDHVLAPYVNKDMEANDIAYGVFVNGALVEFMMCSAQKDSTNINGYKNYLVTYINSHSQYLSIVGSKIVKFDTNGNLLKIDIDTMLVGGADGQITASNYKAGWALYSNADVEEVTILMQGGGNVEIGQTIVNLAESRKDCVACVSPMEEQMVDALSPEIRAKENLISYGASSYRFYDGNYKYQYDAYNDKYRWVPLNGDIAGLMAQTDQEEYPWFSPAGKTIKDCVKLAFYPTKAQRDTMYAATINPVTSFKEEGTVLFGDWTGVTNSLFNFIGVRRLFIYMERNLAAMARKCLWRQNDEVTEETFAQAANPFLRSIQGTRGITDFRVWSGQEATSTDEMMQGIFRAKVAVKPVGSIRWVELVLVATRADVEFDEIVA